MTRNAIETDRSLMWVEIRNGSQQQAFTRTGWALYGEAFSISQTERDWLKYRTG